MNHSLADKSLYLLDMDGTIYLENDLIDGAADFIQWLRDTGRDYVFLTNNSSKSADAYLEKLSRLNIPADRFTESETECKNLCCGHRVFEKRTAGERVYRGGRSGGRNRFPVGRI